MNFKKWVKSIQTARTVIFFENQMSYHFQSGDPQAPQVWPVVIGCIWIFVASNNLKKLEILGLGGFWSFYLRRKT